MSFLLCMIIGHRGQVAGTYKGQTLVRCKTCKRYTTLSGEVVEGRYE